MNFAFDYLGVTESATECLNVSEVNDGYQILSIPLAVYNLARMDIVSGYKDEHGCLKYVSLLRPSGHSTVRLLFPEGKESEVEIVRKKFYELGCYIELGTHQRSIAIDIPPSVHYPMIRKYLLEQEQKETFRYEEACLGQADQ